jgi:hypothetical protein
MSEKDDPIEKLKQQQQFNYYYDLEVIIPEKIINSITPVMSLGITQKIANEEVADNQAIYI